MQTWSKVVGKDRQIWQISKEDAMDHSDWRKFNMQILYITHSNMEWVFFWYQLAPIMLDKGPLNGLLCLINEDELYLNLPMVSITHYDKLLLLL